MALIHHRPDVTAEICLLLYGNCTVTARSWGGAFHCELDPPVEQGSVYRIELDDGRQGSCVVEEICDWSGDRMALIRGLGDLRKADVKSSR
ncbi:MAG TPA: hypothetical protein VM939_00280 [Gemmatimonadaceae bacterium]|nr:hypothetical protein [Gemmatimonadaceae bacterium]